VLLSIGLHFAVISAAFPVYHLQSESLKCVTCGVWNRRYLAIARTWCPFCTETL